MPQREKHWHRQAIALLFVADERGATMVEYGMLIALIAICVMGALYMLGSSINTRLMQLATCLATRACP